MKRRTKMWAIIGRWGLAGTPFLYCGTNLTRRDLIHDAEVTSGRTWKELRAKGDRAIKVIVEWEAAGV
jgi:hypothetical protein